jgi:hypothetical protein
MCSLRHLRLTRFPSRSSPRYTSPKPPVDTGYSLDLVVSSWPVTSLQPWSSRCLSISSVDCRGVDVMSYESVTIATVLKVTISRVMVTRLVGHEADPLLLMSDAAGPRAGGCVSTGFCSAWYLSEFLDSADTLVRSQVFYEQVSEENSSQLNGTHRCLGLRRC